MRALIPCSWNLFIFRQLTLFVFIISSINLWCFQCTWILPFISYWVWPCIVAIIFFAFILTPRVDWLYSVKITIYLSILFFMFPRLFISTVVGLAFLTFLPLISISVSHSALKLWFAQLIIVLMMLLIFQIHCFLPLVHHWVALFTH